MIIPAPITALASFILPGLGQCLNGKFRRGATLFFSFSTALGLFLWRVATTAHREILWSGRFAKTFQLEGGFLIVVGLGLIAVWLLGIWDAWKLAHLNKEGKRQGSPWLFVLVLTLFFSIGWQISEIDLRKLGSEASEAWVPLSKVLWPWEASYDAVTNTTEASTTILADPNGTPPEIVPAQEGQPSITVFPRKGVLSSLDENNDVVPGTLVTVRGKGFFPEEEVQLWWADAMGNEFRPRYESQYVTTLTDSAGAFQVKFAMPYRLIPPSATGPHIHTVMARQIQDTGEIVASEPLKLTINLIIETIFMGMMATFFGIILAIPVSFLAAKNLMSGSRLGISIYYITRTILNIIRSIEPLIWALIAVVWVGLGPFAGIVALTIHSVAALGKLYSEAIEGIDPGPIEAIQATGATKLQTIVYAVIPQMIPPFVSFTIYRWDINVRMSTVIGMVGGGGIGFLLMQYIRLLDYKAAGIAVWFIAVTVSILDYVSARIRERFN
ncbi:MAG: phosphonate ABC transporter, permease protein PhnE [Spirochaetales bacterium]|nr:phosphonate ABC transporter, permease protein PhnE [Spirochaetales bacterium]